MNDQQVWSLVAACALVMIPLGVMLGSIVRARLRRGLPPRYLKRVGERRRQPAPRSQT